MAHHAITPAVEAVCRCKANAGLMRSPRGLHTIVITTEIESGSVAKVELVPFHGSLVSSCSAPLQMEMWMGGRQGKHT
ncbi:hypothetical protein TNCV_652271 [Trichonephila clavipes]|nr:hypothetical protein TNCV_652271 [Trichonephila clavipes]